MPNVYFHLVDGDNMFEIVKNNCIILDNISNFQVLILSFKLYNLKVFWNDLRIDCEHLLELID